MAFETRLVSFPWIFISIHLIIKTWMDGKKVVTWASSKFIGTISDLIDSEYSNEFLKKSQTIVLLKIKLELFAFLYMKVEIEVMRRDKKWKKL